MKTIMRIVSCIPARGGSKSVYKKNIANLNGQPLISYTILDSLATKGIEETYVSTDDMEIKLISEKYGAEVPFLRPSEFATDTSTDLQWVWHFLDWFEHRYNYLPELLVHLRATTPIRDTDIISNAITTFLGNLNYTSLISVEEFPESPYKWMTIDTQNNKLIPFTSEDLHLLPKQLVPKVYKPNGYVDILRPEVVLKGSLHGENIYPFIVPPTVEIDSQEDFSYAEFLMNNKNE